MSQITVTQAVSAADYAAALEVRKAVFVGEQGVPAELEVDENESASAHFLCRVDGKPVGAGRLRQKGDYAKFERIAVLKEYRGKHLGQAIMKVMEEYAATKYPDLLPAMHAQDSAISFYEQIGWITQGPVFYEAGIPHRLMVKAHLRQ